jgi:hypothetical protein
MNRAQSNGGTSRPLFASLRLKDFDVTWAGPNPFRSGFGFGSEDGRLVFTDETGVPLTEPAKGSISGEAINGIAASATSLAVTSRQDVTVRTWTQVQPDRCAVSGVPHGAHGITLAPSGYYVAPLGRAGIMMLRAGSGPGDMVGVMTPGKEGMYFYRVLARAGTDGRDLLVCATRRGGIGIAEVLWGQDTYTMRTATFEGLDVVDVCFVGGPAESPAVAAVGYDGSIILVRDALHDTNPMTMKFDNVQGQVYRLLSVRGHLFLLTSRGLFGLMGLGDRLMRGLTKERFTTSILVIPMQAVDANMVGDRWLLVVMPDEVRIFDVEQIAKDTPERLRDGEMREALPMTLDPSWEFSTVEQRSKELVPAGT